MNNQEYKSTDDQIEEIVIRYADLFVNLITKAQLNPHTSVKCPTCNVDFFLSDVGDTPVDIEKLKLDIQFSMKNRIHGIVDNAENSGQVDKDKLKKFNTIIRNLKQQRDGYKIKEKELESELLSYAPVVKTLKKSKNLIDTTFANVESVMATKEEPGVIMTILADALNKINTEIIKLFPNAPTNPDNDILKCTMEQNLHTSGYCKGVRKECGHHFCRDLSYCDDPQGLEELKHSLEPGFPDHTISEMAKINEKKEEG